MLAESILNFFSTGNASGISPRTTPSAGVLQELYPLVRVSSLPYVPFTNCSNGGLPGRPGEYGCSMAEPKILERFLNHLNLSYVYVKPSDGEYGRLANNGTWTGHIGMILRGEADIAIGGITQTQARNSMAPFSSEIFSDAYTLALHIPGRIPEYQNTWRPFSPTTWALILSCILICAFAAACLSKYAPMKLDDNTDQGLKHEHQASFHYGKNLFKTTALLLGQDMQSNKEGQSKGKLASYITYLCVWQNAAGIISKAYSAAILAILVQPSFYAIPSNMHQVVTQTCRSILYSPWDVTLEPKIRSIGNPVYRKAVDDGRFKKCTTFDCSDWDFTGNDFLIVGSRVFVADWLVMVDPRTGVAPTMSRDTWLRSSLGWPMAMRSPLKPALDDLILRSTAMGIINKIFEDEIVGTKEASLRVRFAASSEGVQLNQAKMSRVDADYEQIVLHLSHFSGAFMILVLGLGAASVAFTAEMMASNTKYVRDFLGSRN